MEGDGHITPAELTEAEKARYAAIRSATGELHSALVSGDADDRAAVTEQLHQALSQLKPADTLDKLHIPEDAGEFEQGLRAVLIRIPPGWGRWITCGKGWYSTIVQLDQALAALDPCYELHQCKEKFGGLRYYFHTADPQLFDQLDELVDAAESTSRRICELCGAPGTIHVSPFGWYRTVCPFCAATNDYDPIGEVVDELTVDHRGAWEVVTDSGTDLWDLHRAEVYTDGVAHRGFTVLAFPRVNSVSRLRLGDGSELVSARIVKIERNR